jgi:hypothetical protein
LLEAIKSLLQAVWNFLRKFVVKVLNFFNNLVDWFKDPSRLKKIRANQNVIAVSIKEKLATGDYQVVNCLFDKSTEKLVDAQQDAVVYNAENLDAETMKQFGSKEMVILQ